MYFICVWLHVCKCPCLLHMCLWRLEVDTRCLPQVPSTLFIYFFLRKGLLLNTELCHLNSVGRFPCLFLSSAGLAGGHQPAQLWHGFWGSECCPSRLHSKCAVHCAVSSAGSCLPWYQLRFLALWLRLKDSTSGSNFKTENRKITQQLPF